MYRIFVTIQKTILRCLMCVVRVCLDLSVCSPKSHTAEDRARIAMNVGQSLFYQIMHVRPITVEYSRDAATADSSQNNNRTFPISICRIVYECECLSFLPLSLIRAWAFINFLVSKSRNQNYTRYICQNVVR